jgi:hypothetical protein
VLKHLTHIDGARRPFFSDFLHPAEDGLLDKGRASAPGRSRRRARVSWW